MKLDEALKALDENPKKVFSCAGMRVTVVSGAYKFTNVNTRKSEFWIGKDNDWQEVKQPVTWQEALEAWANGREITLINVHKELRRITQEVGLLCLSKEKIINGTWYIEEETK